MKKYLAKFDYFAGPQIKEVEVVRETEKTVWIQYGSGKPRRTPKVAHAVSEAYCDSFQLAKKWLLAKATIWAERAEQRKEELPRKIEALKDRANDDILKAKKLVADVSTLTEKG